MSFSPTASLRAAFIFILMIWALTPGAESTLALTGTLAGNPFISGDTVYMAVMSRSDELDADARRCELMAIKVATGELRWRVESSTLQLPHLEPVAISQDETTVFVASSWISGGSSRSDYQYATCLGLVSATDGSLLWKTRTLEGWHRPLTLGNELIASVATPDGTDVIAWGRDGRERLVTNLPGTWWLVGVRERLPNPVIVIQSDTAMATVSAVESRIMGTVELGLLPLSRGQVLVGKDQGVIVGHTVRPVDPQKHQEVVAVLVDFPSLTLRTRSHVPVDPARAFEAIAMTSESRMTAFFSAGEPVDIDLSSAVHDAAALTGPQPAQYRVQGMETGDVLVLTTP